MEVSNVVMTGLGRAMSDLDAKDGELSVCHNIINDNGAMRPIWVPEDVMTLHDNEELVYVHRTAEYRNYVVKGRIRVMNLISVYHKYGKEYPENYLRMTVVLQYPAASRLDVTMRFLIAGHEETRTITFPEGTLGKQVLAMGEQDTFLSASFEAQDGYYNYQLREIDDSNDVSDNATWDENPPEFLYGLNFFTDEDPTRREIVEIPSADYAVKLTSIGNTLVMTSERGLEYILYKDGVYKPLGQKPPFCSISFGLRTPKYNDSVYDRYGEMSQNWANANSDFFGQEFFDLLEKYLSSGTLARDIDYSSYYKQWENEVDPEFTATYVKLVDMMTEKAQELVAEEIQEKKNKNAFVQSFFIRYAYRMYDGKHYMHSAPIFMPINLAGPVLVPLKVEKIDSYNKKVNVGLRLAGGALDYKIIGFYNDGEKVDNEILKDWSDVISGLDIFITSPIFSFKSDGHVWGYSDKSEDYPKETSSISGVPDILGNVIEYYRKTYEEQYKTDVSFTFESLDENDTLTDRIKNASLFYRISGFKNLDELVVKSNFPNREILSIEKGVLNNLELNERLEDDFESHNFLHPAHMVVYNSRLNLSGVKTRLFKGFPLESMVPYSFRTGDLANKNWQVRVNIRKEDGNCSLVSTSNIQLYEHPAYLFYPSTNVESFDVRMYGRTVDENGITLNLDFTQNFKAEEHKFLNGSFYLSPSYGVDDVYGSSFRDLEESGNPYINKYNILYTSEVNNPYYFPLEGVNTIGTGDIMGIATITKALSQGQFGQFPLYVFSTEGVWAMEVAANGLYSSVKPVSRDVCVNGESITQTDNAVLFVTERGVMLLDGSQVVCISDMMNGRSLDVGSVYGLDGLMKDGLDGMTDFMAYAREARMAFDYANSRVVMYHEDRRFCYVFSMTANTWATLGMEIENAVTDYPDVYVQKGSGVKNLSTKADYDAVGRMETLMVTRPVKLGDDGYKTVYELVVRGAMDRKRGAVLLWGSHDGLEYVLIKAVRGNRVYRTGGSGYRYFRIGVVGDMRVGETVSLVSVGFRRRYGNRLR